MEGIGKTGGRGEGGRNGGVKGCRRPGRGLLIKQGVLKKKEKNHIKGKEHLMHQSEFVKTSFNLRFKGHG